MVVRNKIYAAAVPAVSAVGASCSNKFLSVKADGTVSAASGFQ